MNIKFCLIYLIGVFVSSCAQIILKRSAKDKHKSIIFEYINFKVIIGYFLFFASTLLTVYGLSKIDLSVGAVLESFGYVFVSILSYMFLHEKSTPKQILGYAFIMIGVCVFTL